MSTSQKQTTSSSSTSSSQTNPWAPQASAIENAFTQANTAYGQASTTKAPENFVAQFTPEQLATFRSMGSQGGNSAIPASQAAAGSALTGAGANGVQGALSGFSSYDPSSANNPDALVASANKFVAGQDIDAQVRNAMLQATQTARDVTLPGINQNAANTGNTNSSRTGIAEGLVERGLAQQSADLGATLRSNAFQTGLGLAQTQAANNNTNKVAALTGLGALGTGSVAAGVNAGTSSLNSQGALNATAMAGGAGLQASEQAKLDDIIAQFKSGTTAPFAALHNLMSIIGGQSWGSSTSGRRPAQRPRRARRASSRLLEGP